MPERLLRRFAAVSTVVTIVDIVVLALVRDAGRSVAVADTAAVVVASLASWLLHRSVTLHDDPYVRWIRTPSTFVATASLAGGVDIVVTTALSTAMPLAAAKIIGLLVSGVVRTVAYRAVLFTDQRRELRTKRDRPALAGAHRFTVVMPAYRAADRVAESIATVRDALADIDTEILVVDDGSTDDTAARAEAAGARVIRLPANRGKGAAVRAGMLAATGRAVAFTDVDLAYPPEQLRGLLAQIEDGWDVVVGNRWHQNSEAITRPSYLRQLSSRMFNALTATVLLAQYRDTQCGCKAFRSDVARTIFEHTKLDGFAFDVEVLHLVERYRFSLKEIPVRVAEDGSSTVRVRAVAVGMIRDLFRVRRWGSEGAYELTPKGVPTGDS